MHVARFRDPAGSVRTGEWQSNGVAFGDRTYGLDEADILPPSSPSKLVCVGRNYAAHAEETGSDVPDRPILFLKGPNALAGHRDTVTLPAGKDRIDYEAELAVVIGEQCRNVSAADAMDVVAGFTAANDLSNRDDQRQETNWVRGKAFDNAAPLGPAIVPPGEVPDDARVRCLVNGEIKQDSPRSHMIFDVPTLIEATTAYLTLEPGDAILTGTPEGVGPLSDGDTVEIDIDGIPTLSNEIVIP